MTVTESALLAQKARELLARFKGETYLFGGDVLARMGALVSGLGHRVALVRGTFPGSDAGVQVIRRSLTQAGLDVDAEIKGVRPNAPKEDLKRLVRDLRVAACDVVVSFGGGSTIDATKAAAVLVTLGGDIDDYFGTALVTQALAKSGASLPPHVAIQTVASSAAHLTKYSNITDLAVGQKKLIVDDAIVPVRCAFDYGLTHGVPAALTADGAFDGLSHILEVLYGSAGRPHYETVAEIASTGLALVFEALPQALRDPTNARAREALCLATDLGGYAIMVGGTNGGHLTSFSLVDLMSHGRACALMNPYYTVFFAPAIEKPLRLVAEVCRRTRLTDVDFDGLHGRDLGIAVADVLQAFARDVGVPTRLADIEGFGQGHIDRALTAAKDIQLEMKLRNMPIPLTAEMVDKYMGSVLAAACDGDLRAVKNVP
jgi:alcohol dehydrogenase